MMLKSNPNHHSTVSRHPWPTALRLMLFAIIIILAIALLPAVNSFVQTMSEPVILSFAQPETAAVASQLNDADPVVRDQAIQQLASIGTVEATDQLIAFFKRDTYLTEHGRTTAKALASTGSTEALQTLIQALRQNELPPRRMAAMAALEKARPSVTPMLITALSNPDAGIRLGAAELLGFRHATEATTALLSATRDSKPAVREAAIWALSEVAGLQSLDRFAQMQVTDLDLQAREAASKAEESIYSRVATTLEVERADLRAIAVAAASGQAYAVSMENLYALQDSQWQRVAARLPDAPTALAVSSDGQSIYLGTTSLGLFRSVDDGHNWQRVELPVANFNRLLVSAVVVNPVDARQIYVALAAVVGTSAVHTNSLGILRSSDGGNTWVALVNVPMEQVTMRLIVDQTTPDYLYGVTENGAWRTKIH